MRACMHDVERRIVFSYVEALIQSRSSLGQPQLGALRPHALADINVLLLVMLHASYYESSTSRFVFHIMLHVLLHVGLMFHPSNQDVLEECRFKLLIKTCR